MTSEDRSSCTNQIVRTRHLRTGMIAAAQFPRKYDVGGLVMKVSPVDEYYSLISLWIMDDIGRRGVTLYSADRLWRLEQG